MCELLDVQLYNLFILFVVLNLINKLELNKILFAYLKI